MKARRSTAGWTSEARARQSTLVKAALASPRVRARMVAASHQNWADPDYRDAVSAGLRRAWAKRRARLDSQQSAS